MFLRILHTVHGSSGYLECKIWEGSLKHGESVRSYAGANRIPSQTPYVVTSNNQEIVSSSPLKASILEKIFIIQFITYELNLYRNKMRNALGKMAFWYRSLLRLAL